MRVEILFDEPITFLGADGQPTHAPMVAATVGGEATRLIVDTGSTDHILTIELANRVGLRAEPGEEGTDSTGASVPSWSLGEVPVEIGHTTHQLSNVIAIAAPGPFAARGIGGILSPQHLVPGAWMSLDMAGDRFTALSGSEADVADWLAARAPDFRLLRLARADGDTTILVRGAIKPHQPVITLMDTGGKASDVVASAVPGLTGGLTESSGRGVGGTELFGAVVVDQVLRVGEADIPMPRLVVIGDVDGRGILVGMDVLRGTILTVSADPARPVFWQVPCLARHRTCSEMAGMCLTCGCMQAHLDMGPKNIRYEDLKDAADENGRSVAETLDIWQRTLEIDRGDHSQEYAAELLAAEELQDPGGVVRERPAGGDLAVLHVVDLGRPVVQRASVLGGGDVHQLHGVGVVGEVSCSSALISNMPIACMIPLAQGVLTNSRLGPPDLVPLDVVGDVCLRPRPRDRSGVHGVAQACRRTATLGCSSIWRLLRATGAR